MDEDEELNFIDCGVHSISTLHLSRSVTVLNLHANRIKKIDGLHELTRLRQLDLSSNQITRIEGLDDLQSLRTLNLSFNKIQYVTGLQHLTSLVHINLSHNDIRDVSGFRQLGGPDCKLASVELQGNCLRMVGHVCANLAPLRSLRHLVLLSADRANPLCHSKDYRRTVLNRLKGLECLDGKDRKGEAVQTALAADMPDITEFLEFITSDTTSSVDPVPPNNLQTPKIDAALRAFHRREQPSATDSEASSFRTAQIRKLPTEYQNRLETIERKLDSLAAAQQSETVENVENHKMEVNKPGTLKRTRSDANKSNPLSARSSNASPVPSRSARTAKSSVPKEGLDPASVKTTIEQVLQRLENERERRARAEDVSRRLMEQMKKIQDDSRGDAVAQQSAFKASSKLREAYANERSMRQECEERLKMTQEDLQRALREAESAAAAEADLRRRLELSGEETAAAEVTKRKEISLLEKQLHDQQRRAAAAQRELDIIRDQLERSRSEADRVRGLMADREEAHKNELSRRFALDSPELQAMIDKCVRQEQEKCQERVQHLQEKLTESRTQFVQLEDEFRMALRIEAARQQELLQSLEKRSREAEKLRSRYHDIRKREEEARRLVGELNNMVKEKDIALQEIGKSRQESTKEHKERIANLEANIDEARRRLEQMEQLRQENKKLRGQTHAQESIIEGLRTERQLWGEELAKQGSSLAQDRGRLESQIVSLSNENARLKTQLEKEFDDLKINRKIAEDQRDTILKMKEGLREKDAELKKLQCESLELQRELESTVHRQLEVIDSQKETIAKLTDRKEEVKREASGLQNDLDELRQRHEREVAQWSERAKAVGVLQDRYDTTKTAWDKERNELTSERDRAVEAARTALERLKTADAAFRRQLDAKETSHRQQLETTRAEAAQSEREALQRVEAVEAELRFLLAEKERTERELKAKLMQLVGGLAADLT